MLGTQSTSRGLTIGWGSRVLFQGYIKSLLTLCIYTTRIILGCICFGPIRCTGRPRPPTTLLRHSLFSSKSHKTVDECGCTSNCYCICTYHCGGSSALVLALKGPTVLTAGWWWVVVVAGPLLSFHHCLCHCPPQPPLKGPVEGCFYTHYRAWEEECLLSSAGPGAVLVWALHACWVFACFK